MAVILRYPSNKVKVADGTRVADVWTDDQGAQHLAFLVDRETKNYAEVEVLAAPAQPVADPVPVDPAPVEPAPPTDVAPPATSQSAPTVGSITVADGSVQVRGVSRPGICFALINRNPNRLSGEVIEGAAATSFAVPAHQTTTGSIDATNVAPGSHLHLTIRGDDGQYSIDNPQIWK